MSKLDEFDLNDTVTARASFLVGSTLTDPTEVTLNTFDPSGNLDSYTYGAAQIDRDSQGVFHKDIVIDEPGEWIATWTGSGAVTASGTKRFAVRRSGA